MGKGICKYTIPMKPPYQYPYACAVMYECRYEAERNRGGEFCPRFEIGKNMEQSGQELKGRRVVQRYDDIRKAMEDPSVEEVVIQKHSALGKTDQMLEIVGVLTKGEVK